MKLLRRVVFWAHLATGLAAGIVVLVMSVTGVLLTYQKQITAWADMRDIPVQAAPAGAARLPAAELLRRVAAREEGKPTAITWRARSGTAEVAFGRERTVIANAYTGAVLGEASQGVRSFFGWVTGWHRWLGRADESRDWGKAITGAANLGFLFLVASGFYLWWPRNWSARALRNVVLFRRGLPGKARDFNWHNVIGFWSAVPLFVVVLSGVVISYPWASELVYAAVGESASARPAGGPAGPGGPAGGREGGEVDAGVALAGEERLWARAGAEAPDWRSVTMQIPAAPDAPLSMTVDRGTGGEPQKRATLSLERETGELRWEPFSAGSAGRQLRSILRFAHTGEVGGIIGQTIAGLVSLGAVLLVWTGIALAWRRMISWLGRRKPRKGDYALRIPNDAETSHTSRLANYP